jgi:hypothetical protein
LSGLLHNALSHPGGMAYSPLHGLLLAIILGAWSGYLVVSALLKGTVPRARPLWGKLPPEMGTVISRDKEPNAFWRNVWAGCFLFALSLFCAGLSIAFMFDPSL